MRKKQRMVFVLAMLAAMAVAASLAGYALRDKVSLFFTPVDALALRDAGDARVAVARDFRLGGLVKEGSVQPRGDDMAVRFVVTDRAREVDVTYSGVLPDLFREGQGVIVTGSWDAQAEFTAHTLLAKHDENYMPPEVAKGLERVKDSDIDHLREQQEGRK